ncbi:hypothetical protein [Janthinobacterium sp. MDT1-19]|uniref:hypothetical protein n=1 Tax=Janthinobacterium sp. MDT1-19 TaxID=1259339 RepID=UPI003F276BC7
MSTSLSFESVSRFTTEAIESLITLRNIVKRAYPQSSSAMDETIRVMRAATKFSLPDDALLIDLKDYRQEFSALLRLPYPIVTLEYANFLPPEPGSLVSSKRIIVAWTHEASTVFKVKNPWDRAIYFTQLYYDDEQSEWEPSTVVWGFNPDELAKDEHGEFLVTGFHDFPCHPEMYENLTQDQINSDLENGFKPLLEFCLTVNCENVKSTVVEPPAKLAKKRTKNNREPLYSYHVLNLPGDVEQGESGTRLGSRDGPRVHWRRGHLRRLSDSRIIWVRHALIGNPERGSVDKSYKVNQRPLA